MYKQLRIIGLLAVFIDVVHAKDAWLSDSVPKLCLANDDVHEARRLLRDIYEVPKSRSDTALSRLEKVRFRKLVENEAKFFLGEFYEKPGNKDPYLVRAVYGHGGTGGFSFNWCGDDILIVHLSLGKGRPENRTALILNLDKAPKNVYISMHTAL